MITVAELVAALSAYPPHLPVVFEDGQNLGCTQVVEALRLCRVVPHEETTWDMAYPDVPELTDDGQPWWTEADKAAMIDAVELVWR